MTFTEFLSSKVFPRKSRNPLKNCTVTFVADIFHEDTMKLLVNLALAALWLAPCVAHGQAATLPATGVWNGFLNHQNVVECANLTENAENAVLSIADYTGRSLGTTTFTLPARGAYHVSLNGFNIADSYGSYVVNLTNPSPRASITCFTAIYRLSAAGAGKPVEYAYSLPLLSPLAGESYGVANSYDPSSSGVPVSNFLSIYNPGSFSFSANVYLYSQDGALNTERSFRVANLLPNERRDFAVAHEQGQMVMTYRIVPDNSLLPYGAFITRFSSDGHGRFKFAFPLLASAGSCAPGPVPASTMNPAINWGEVANPTGSPIDARIIILDRYGRRLLNELRTIPAYSQHHTHINSYLGESNVGTFLVTCENPAAGRKLLVQSLYYGRYDSSSSDVEWAYASQGLGNVSAGSLGVASQINTYLGAANWNKILDDSGSGAALTLNTVNSAGALRARRTYSVPAGGSIDVGLHEIVGAEFVGNGFFTPTGSAELYPELLRVFSYSGGQIGYIMSIPNTIAVVPVITEDVPTDPSNGTTSRAQIIADYQANYIGSELSYSDVGWTGSASSCAQGTISATAHTKTLQRINYFRRLAGLPGDIVFNTTKSNKDQAAALMMSANSSLSHYPPSSWKCYTANGSEAAGKSNLALGYSTPTGAITGYIADYGSNNAAVGHRRWILYSLAKEMGNGFAGSGHALWVIGDFKSSAGSIPEFIAWPPKGYVPSTLVPGRWSISIPGADFSSSAVTMTGPGGAAQSLTQLTVANGYGDNTLVWETTANTSASSDISYTVRVNGVKLGGATKNYEYTVTIINSGSLAMQRSTEKGELGDAPVF